MCRGDIPGCAFIQPSGGSIYEWKNFGIDTFHISQKEKNNIIQAVAKRLTEEGLTTKIETRCKFENDILVIQWISNI